VWATVSKALDAAANGKDRTLRLLVREDYGELGQQQTRKRTSSRSSGPNDATRSRSNRRGQPDRSHVIHRLVDGLGRVREEAEQARRTGTTASRRIM
jgi:hypothetical protein